MPYRDRTHSTPSVSARMGKHNKRKEDQELQPCAHEPCGRLHCFKDQYGRINRFCSATCAEANRKHEEKRREKDRKDRLRKKAIEVSKRLKEMRQLN